MERIIMYTSGGTERKIRKILAEKKTLIYYLNENCYTHNANWFDSAERGSFKYT